MKNSNNSEIMSILLEMKLREYAKVIRDKYAENGDVDQFRSIKETFLGECYKMLVIFLGKPPKEFVWEWRDKEEKFHRHGKITPVGLFNEYINVNLDDYVCLINAPTGDKPLNRTFTVKNLGNVVEGRPIRYLNVDMESIERAAMESIMDNHAVWFGCDVGQMLATEPGAMDLGIYDYDRVFGTGFNLDRASRLDHGWIKMTHAMLLTGVDLDENGRARKWRMENSWGAKIKDNGFMYMMDRWFDDYLYEIVMSREYLPLELIRALETEPVPLEPWDPMGSLARSNIDDARMRRD